MAKPSEPAGDKPAETSPTPEPAAAMMRVRKGRFTGQYSRSFQSVPFGEALLAKPGQEYTVTEAFRYLWTDPQFAAVWEWLGDEQLVPAVNPEQVKYS